MNNNDNKLLYYYPTLELFKTKLAANQVNDAAINLIQDKGILYTRGTYINLSDIIISNDAPTDDQLLWVDMSANGEAVSEKIYIGTTEPTNGQLLWINPDTNEIKYNNNGTWTAIGGGVEEAPIDSLYYARKNGEWVSVDNYFITINMTTNQSSHTDIDGVKATVTYNESTFLIGSGETFSIAVGSSCTISFPEVTGYKKPDDIAITASYFGTTTRDVIYQTEVVTVTVTTEDSASVAGQKVTINDAVYTLDDTGVVTAKVPYETSYSISVDSKSGYVIPASLSFTANQASRAVSMIYETIKLGVFIQDKSGKLWTTDQWNTANNANANAIAVLTNNVKVLVALTDSGETKQMSNDYESPIDNYCTAISNEASAKKDYKGKTNTANILKTVSSTSYAAGWANAFTFPDGTKGHLPALGEFWEVYQNKAAVDAALAKCGGTAMNTSYYHWCSTFWGVGSDNDRLCWILHWSYGNAGYNYLNDHRSVRAFAVYNP